MKHVHTSWILCLSSENNAAAAAAAAADGRAVEDDVPAFLVRTMVACSMFDNDARRFVVYELGKLRAVYGYGYDSDDCRCWWRGNWSSWRDS